MTMVQQLFEGLILSYKLFQLCEVFSIRLTYPTVCHYNISNVKNGGILQFFHTKEKRMKKWSWKKGLAAALGLMLSAQAPLGAMTPVLETYAYTERSAKVNASSLNVRSGAGTSYSQVTKLSRNAAVTVIGETTGSDGKLWYQIRFSGSGGTVTTGYALSTYISFPVTYNHDSNFESYLNAQGFPDTYKDSLRQLHAKYPNWVFEAQQTGLDWNTVIQNEGVLGRNLVGKNSISSFKSIVDGAYNWDTSTWNGFDGSAWVAASEDILRYYMDPRNFLDEVSVFQFMTHGYDPSVHTRAGLESLLKGTFMEYNASVSAGGGSTDHNSGGSSGTVVGPGGSGGSGVVVAPSGDGGASSGSGNNTGGSSAPAVDQDQVSFEAPSASVSKKDVPLVATTYGPGVVSAGPGVDSPGGSSPGGSDPSGSGTASMTGSVNYADIIMNAASQSGVNPYVIAAMILQEQGRNGTGNSIKGSYAGYNGYYNYFNVGAYASDGMGAVERGLWYASQSGSYGRPWTSPESSIVGGAQFYATNYTNAGQDTFYLKKYNVQGSNLYKHQYMTNVDGAASEGSIFAEGFSETLKESALRFKIPVYTNMPASPCVMPTLDGSPNNKLGSLGAEGFVLTPTFNKDVASYDLIVDHSVASVNIYANALNSEASISGTGNIQLQSGNNDITITVKAGNGTVRQYVIHVVRQTNGPTYNAGIGNTTGGSTGTTDPSGGPGISDNGPGISNGGPGISNGGSGSSGGVEPGTTAPADGGNAGTPGGSNVIVIS